MKKEVIEECNVVLTSEQIKTLINEITDLKNQLSKEKQAYINMYNMYDEEKKKNEKAIEYIEKHTENIDRGQYYEDYVETYFVLQILKGEDKE